MKVIIFFLALNPIFLYAQNSFPTSATNPQWIVGSSNLFGTPISVNYNLGNQVEIGGKYYQEIKALYPRNSQSVVAGYVRNEGKKVYVRTLTPVNGGNLSNEMLMYDFSLEVNKKIYCAAFSLENPTDSTICFATFTDSVIYRGIKRKIWNVMYSEKRPSGDPPYFYPTTWIEGIGATDNPFFPLHCISEGCESSSATICFHESNVLKFMNPHYSSCSTRITDIKNPLTEQEVKLYPKLATYQLTVENNGLSNLNIQISNSLGQLFITKQLGNGINTIDINSLAAGIYFATMSDGHKRRTEKFVKN